MSDTTVIHENGTESRIKAWGISVSVRAIVVLMLVGTCCALASLQIKVEEPLYSAFLLGLGYYFGQKK